MDLGLLIPVLVLAPLCLIALWQLPKMWRFKADIERTEATKQWWPFGEALRHGFVRGMPVGILAATALTASMTLVLVEESTSGSTSRAAAEAAWITFLAFVGLILVDLLVTLFNWPKVVVPPATRDEPGALALWRRGVKHRRSRRPKQTSGEGRHGR
jgi:hypothetical protein